MFNRTLIAAALASLPLIPAAAQPGLGEKVYSARLEPGASEVELRYGRLTGGPAAGEDAIVAEVAHSFGKHFHGGLKFEFEREPPGRRRLEAVGFEAMVPFGRIDAIGIDAGVYVEYEAVRGGADKLETKLLLQRTRGSFDARLNLIAEKELKSGEPVEFGYAASADWKLVGDFRLGAAAFGELGTARRFLPRAQHYAGPIVKTELEGLPGKGELGIEAGYLFALGAARDEAKGQLRLLLEYEFRF
jgi:hypothetical protein